MSRPQDKAVERDFFDRHAEGADYDVFTAETNEAIVTESLYGCELAPGDLVLDLGCGAGVFTQRLVTRRLKVVGLDLSRRLLTLAFRRCPGTLFIAGDVEALPFRAESARAVFLFGVLHHFPDPVRLLQEVHRVLTVGGRVVTFDPNRQNPFMWLYRCKSSPLYSPKGVTPNEEPVSPTDVVCLLREAGFSVDVRFFPHVSYRWVASNLARSVLPIYNIVAKLLFGPALLAAFRPFVLAVGVKLGDDSDFTGASSPKRRSGTPETERSE